jgi:ribosomal protein S18 acetylase RimI-like enzyme
LRRGGKEIKGNEAAMTNHDFQIRRADAEDGEAIVACLEAAFARYRAQYTPQAFADTVLNSETIQHRLREMCLFVAISDREVVGTIGCTAKGEEGHLRGMAVSTDWQGTGVASALLQAVEAELRNGQCKCVTLDTTQPVERAVRFYERHGFSASGRVSDFFGMRLYEYMKSL